MLGVATNQSCKDDVINRITIRKFQLHCEQIYPGGQETWFHKSWNITFYLFFLLRIWCRCCIFICAMVVEDIFSQHVMRTNETCNWHSLRTYKLGAACYGYVHMPCMHARIYTCEKNFVRCIHNMPFYQHDKQIFPSILWEEEISNIQDAPAMLTVISIILTEQY